MIRAAAGITLTAAAAWLLLNRGQPTRPRDQRPPETSAPHVGFWSWADRDALVEAGRRLRPAEAARIRDQLRTGTSDPHSRGLFLAWLWHQGPEAAAERAALVLSMIRHEPASEWLDWAPARFAPGELAPQDFSALVDAWREAIARSDPDPRIAFRAAQWAGQDNPRLFVGFLQQAVEAQPDFEPALEALARWCVKQIRERSNQAAEAKLLLESSLNPMLQTWAARLFRAAAIEAQQAGQPLPQLEAAARDCIRRARQISPQLDEAAFEPPMTGAGHVPPTAAWAPFNDIQPAINASWKSLHRLGVEAFPGLPPAVVSTMRELGCQIPQPYEAPHRPGPQNVISGHFFDAGTESWAALCSVSGTVRLLAFRGPFDTAPVTLVGGLEISYFQMLDEQKAGFSWLITPTGPSVIRRYHEAYGGPALPPLAHDGIESHFLGKASVILYWHDGRWLRLQGAD